MSTTDDGRIQVSRFVIAALLGLALLSNFVFSNLLAVLFVLLVLPVATFMAQRENLAAFGRCCRQIKRDGRGWFRNHMRWYWRINRQLDSADPNREEESAPGWYLCLVTALGIVPMMAWMLVHLSAVVAVLFLLLGLAVYGTLCIVAWHQNRRATATPTTPTSSP